MGMHGNTLPNTVYISLNSRPKKGEYVSPAFFKIPIQSPGRRS